MTIADSVAKQLSPTLRGSTEGSDREQFQAWVTAAPPDSLVKAYTFALGAAFARKNAPAYRQALEQIEVLSPTAWTMLALPEQARLLRSIHSSALSDLRRRGNRSRAWRLAGHRELVGMPRRLRQLVLNALAEIADRSFSKPSK